MVKFITLYAFLCRKKNKKCSYEDSTESYLTICDWKQSFQYVTSNSTLNTSYYKNNTKKWIAYIYYNNINNNIVLYAYEFMIGKSIYIIKLSSNDEIIYIGIYNNYYQQYDLHNNKITKYYYEYDGIVFGKLFEYDNNKLLNIHRYQSIISEYDD